MTHYYSTDILPSGGAEFRSRESTSDDTPAAIGYYCDRTGIMIFANHAGAEDFYDGLESIEAASDLYAMLLEEQAQEDACYNYPILHDRKNCDVDSDQLSQPTRPGPSWYRSLLSFLCPSATVS